MKKPEGSLWTDDQWQAIVRKDQDILVAAAAGSGKTAVLVERIIRRISDDRQPMDVDRLLVATFTKAAAAEMRHRIRDALEKALRQSPDSEHLRRQLALLNRASITTLHSFCMDVIRRYFSLIELDPGFRIADETEAELLRQEVLEALLEEAYAESEEGSPFWLLTEWFGGEKSDAPFLALINRLYDASRSHPSPTRWLEAMGDMYGIWEQHTEVFPSDHPWLTSLLRDVRLELAGADALLEGALRLTEEPGGPSPYAETLQTERSMLQQMAVLAAEESASGWERLYEESRQMSFGKLKACRGDGYDKPLQEQAQKLRNAAKDKVNRLREELLGRSPQEFARELRMLAPLMKELVSLVEAYAERVQIVKKDRNVLDFADLEHYCLQILADPALSSDASGQLIPSAAARAYQEQFDEILLDEYQDTNAVQEAIVRLISRETPGNRFMVGDVKQSIYRFRLADPGLFLQKYRTYRSSQETAGSEELADRSDGETGLRIDLARNFRSRSQVVDAVNFLFRQIMSETVGELDYDRSAELVCGASYPEQAAPGHDFRTEFLLVTREEPEDKGNDAYSDQDDEDGAEDGRDGAAPETEADEAADLETAQLEARMIGRRIRELMGLAGGEPFQVAERSGEVRHPTFRDFVILLRATERWSPVLIEELKRMGIPAYAEVNTGYFSAIEVETMLALLQVIDNPDQDIPLAAVLRSPFAGLTADELAQVRMAERRGTFYEALVAFWERTGELIQKEPPLKREAVHAEQLELFFPGWPEAAAGTETGGMLLGQDIQWIQRLQAFRSRLEEWRLLARQGSLAELIWTIYRQTGYYDYAGALPGGAGRQANLRALYDRARQYEATSLRGLFRFLRFIEKMRERGSDLGTAKALGEQEDVVRIMSIHKSKGLEFPIVFVAGLGKLFNQQDTNGSFLIHKEMGFGPRFMDRELRVAYPTLPQLAIRRRMRLETLAEEMRVFYVALTRAKEKLILLGTVKEMERTLLRWSRSIGSAAAVLPDYVLAQARSCLDWVGPALLQHPHASEWRQWAFAAGGLAGKEVPGWAAEDGSCWQFSTVSARSLAGAEHDSPDSSVMETEDILPQLAEKLKIAEPLPQEWAQSSDIGAEAIRRLEWQDPYREASRMLTKTSVSELKRLNEKRTLRLSADEFSWEAPIAILPAEAAARYERVGAPTRNAFRKPAFLSERTLDAAAVGTVYHAVMQHTPIGQAVTADHIRSLMDELVQRHLLTNEEAASVDPGKLSAFWQSELGQRLIQANEKDSGCVRRELPFSYGLRADDMYPDTASASGSDTILVQGVIDCLFEDEAGLVLIDFKTDALRGMTDSELADKYRIQLRLYARAVSHIWRKPVGEAYLYFFDGPRLVPVSLE